MEKFLIQDLRRIEEKAASVSEIRWEWDPPHMQNVLMTPIVVSSHGLSQKSHCFCLGFLHFVVSCSCELINSCVLLFLGKLLDPCIYIVQSSKA